MAAMLKVKEIHCGYDGAPVIRGLSLEVNEGEIVAILGANGAGKSTTMRTICGLMHPEKGQILFRGEDITRSPASENIRKGISYIPEGRRLFPKLSVRENLELGAFTVTDRAVIEERLEEMFTIFPKLKARSSQTAETLSGGEQQMLAIGRALMARPELMLMDEPSMGLAPLLVKEIFEIIKDINAQGTTILLVEQNANMALSIADKAFVIETGEIVLQGTAAELMKSEDVKKAYLGG